MNRRTGIISLFVFLLLLGGGVLFAKRPAIQIQQNALLAAFASIDLGIAFDYPMGPSGYTLTETTPSATTTALIRSITLTQTKDIASAPFNGELPPTISLLVFTNPQKQWSPLWADTHPQFSDIDRIMGARTDTVVGGANALRYTADGLYATDTVVVAHGSYVYVFKGMYLDSASPIHTDFSALIASVRFIPQPGQE